MHYLTHRVWLNNNTFPIVCRLLFFCQISSVEPKRLSLEAKRVFPIIPILFTLGSCFAEIKLKKRRLMSESLLQLVCSDLSSGKKIISFSDNKPLWMLSIFIQRSHSTWKKTQVPAVPRYYTLICIKLQHDLLYLEISCLEKTCVHTCSSRLAKSI